MERLHSPKIWEIASALRLSVNGSPADAILKYCDDRAETMLADFPECATPTELLDVMAAMLGTSFEEVRSDDDLLALQKRYVSSGEFGFASLDKDLNGDGYGVTYRRMAACAGERPFVSVIDCRGNKALRSYFTKWHEIGHLLILTDAQRRTYRRTHSRGTSKDPEETLVDIIAGHMGFFPRFLLPEIGADVTFAEVDRIRLKLYPDASFQSSAIVFTKHHHLPCLLLEAKLALKKNEEASLLQGAFTFYDPPTPKLRVHMVVFSDMAKEHGLYIPRNYRVPESSIIHQVHTRGEEYGIASECLSLWESSDGKQLTSLPIRMEVRKSFDSVLTLISVASEKRENEYLLRREAGRCQENG
jgi:hypothetical protein